LFFDKLYRRAEEIMKQSPFRLIKLIEKGNDLRDIEPVISKPLSDVNRGVEGQVYLFSISSYNGKKIDLTL